MSEPRVVIVDDHQLFRSGVRAELEPLLQIAAEAGTVEEAEAAETQAATQAATQSTYSAGGRTTASAPEGSLASDEALQALRDKLTGGN